MAMEATLAVQAHGDIESSRENDVEGQMRDAKITQIYKRTSEAPGAIVAHAVSSAPTSGPGSLVANFNRVLRSA
ncbi:hypothetical protein CSOJ01_15853 [Colletotrichum sojae]|uniref:Uncharacterized protein n=1 Tax=Colletotrichum sojae TaxID=2175907 RepID=A0A8H6MI11_9PEZI|nr:hypothetical protein CSOJ01_15853 [Colletotrichum sojae]